MTWEEEEFFLQGRRIAKKEVEHIPQRGTGNPGLIKNENNTERKNSFNEAMWQRLLSMEKSGTILSIGKSGTFFFYKGKMKNSFHEGNTNNFFYERMFKEFFLLWEIWNDWNVSMTVYI